MSVWFGLHLPSYTHPDTPPEQLFDRVVEQAQAAEAAGFGLVTVMDHLYQIDGIGGPDEPMLEGWSVLAALARETTRVRLGTLVTGVTYRNPALLAKQVDDARHDLRRAGDPRARRRLERGRARGLRLRLPADPRADGSAGGSPRDHQGDVHRGAAELPRDAITGSSEALNVPRPVQPGGPKILVGGGGEQRTLRIAAKYADMTHWFPLGIDTLKHKTEVLERYCEEIGRDPSTIERTTARP